MWTVSCIPVGCRHVSAEHISSLSSLTAACFLLAAGNFLFLFGSFSAFLSAEPFAITKFWSNVIINVIQSHDQTYTLLLQPFHGSLDFVRDYPGEPVPER